MPSTIVPQAQAIGAEARRMFLNPQAPLQGAWHLPKHYPVKQVESLLLAVMEFTRQAEQVGRLWDLHEEAERAQWEATCAQWEEQEDGRQFLETCAAEHSFRDILA